MKSSTNKFNLLRPSHAGGSQSKASKVASVQQKSYANECNESCTRVNSNAIDEGVELGKRDSRVNRVAIDEGAELEKRDSRVNSVPIDKGASVQHKSSKVSTTDTFDYEKYGDQKLNTPWSLWFHHDPNDWKISGYTKITTMYTVKEYATIMNRLHKVESIKNINLYLFRENIEPIWEFDANEKGGDWSIKEPIENGYDIWKQIADKMVSESLLKADGINYRNSIDINGTINGCSINSKSTNVIVKIRVSDKKISNQSLIDPQIRSQFSSKIMYQLISPDQKSI